MIIQSASEPKHIFTELKALFEYKLGEFQMYLDPNDNRVLQLIWAVEMAVKYNLDRVVILN